MTNIISSYHQLSDKNAPGSGNYLKVLHNRMTHHGVYRSPEGEAPLILDEPVGIAT